MRINDIIVEQQLEEGPLGAIARGAGKVLGGIAKGAGAIAGIGQGMKRAFGKGKAASAATIAGDVPQQPKPQGGVAQQAFDQEYARITQPQQGSAAQPQAAAAQPAAGGAAQAPAQGAASSQAPQPQQQAQGGAQPRAEPTMSPQQSAGGGNLAAVIKQVDALKPEEKKQVLTTLQQPQGAAQPAADAGATPKPAAQPAAQAQGAAQAQQGGNFDAQTGKPTSQTGQDLEKQIQDAKQAAAQKMGRGLSPQEEQEIEGEIRGTMKPKAAPPADDNPNIVRGTESVQRRGKMVREYTEEFILYRPQTVRTALRESRRPKQKYTIYKS